MRRSIKLNVKGLLSLMLLATASAGYAQSVIYRYNLTTGEHISNITLNASGIASSTQANNAGLTGLNWLEVIQTGRLLGQSTTIPRYQDLVGTSDRLVYVGTNGITYALDILSTNGAVSNYRGASVFGNSGPHSGADYLSDLLVSVNLTDVYFLDPDGSLSAYDISTGGLANDYTYTTLTGGNHAGSLEDALRSTYFGAPSASGNLYFINPDGTWDGYNRANGQYNTTSTWSTFSSGPLDGVSLLEALESGTYLGISNNSIFFLDTPHTTIPEPSTAVLSVLAPCALLFRRRRKA